MREVRAVQADILEAHKHDFRKHKGKSEAVRLARVWDSVTAQLARENKKWRFSEVTKHARARDYADTVEWLALAGLVLRCHRARAPRVPLAGYCDEGAYKLYLLDVGLLGARLGLSERTIVSGNHLFVEYHGAFAENFVAQELTAARSTVWDRVETSGPAGGRDCSTGSATASPRSIFLSKRKRKSILLRSKRERAPKRRVSSPMGASSRRRRYRGRRR
jgi:hypothetical protein